MGEQGNCVLLQILEQYFTQALPNRSLGCSYLSYINVISQEPVFPLVSLEQHKGIIANQWLQTNKDKSVHLII